MDKTKTLRRAVAFMLAILVLALASVFIESLKPSVRANALNSQFRFSASLLEDLEPGDVRQEMAGIGPIFVVVPDSDILGEIERATPLAKHPEHDSFDQELGAFIVWGVSPKQRGPNCALLQSDGYVDWEGTEIPGGFFDPCTGDRFDYAGRVLVDTHRRGVENLLSPEFELVSNDAYMITNTAYLFEESSP